MKNFVEQIPIKFARFYANCAIYKHTKILEILYNGPYSKGPISIGL